MSKNVGSIKTCSAEYPVGVGSSRLELKSECAVFFFFNRAFSGCFAILKNYNNSETAVYVATIQLCFEFFRCRVDALQS